MPVKKWSDMMNDAAKAETRKFVPLEPDTYQFVIKEQPTVESKDGVDTIVSKPAVESGPRAGATIFHRFRIDSESATSLDIFFNQMTALGLGPDFFAQEPDINQVANALVGRRFSAEAYKREYNGKDYVNLRRFTPPVGPAPAGGPGVPTPNAVPSATPSPVVAAPTPAAPSAQVAESPWGVQAPAQPVAQAAPENPWGVQAAPQAAPQQFQQTAQTPPPPPSV